MLLTTDVHALADTGAEREKEERSS